jgi:hypothetical protein
MAAAWGPLTRISAKAETPGGVAQAAMVSFSKATEINISKKKGEPRDGIWLDMESERRGVFKRR